jgi:hypothetical protein
MRDKKSIACHLSKGVLITLETPPKPIQLNYTNNNASLHLIALISLIQCNPINNHTTTGGE